MCCDQTPWLVEHVAVPAIFVLLGALLGFVAGQIKDYFDSRRIKRSFLKAIRIELTTLRKHLEGTLKDVTEVLDGLRKKVPEKLCTFLQNSRSVFIPLNLQGCEMFPIRSSWR